MQLVDRAKAAMGTFSDADIDFKRYMNREEKARIIPASVLAERGRERMLLGKDGQPGLSLPWSKADGKVRIAQGKLALWTGWSRHGKSQMLKQVMAYAVQQDERVGIASMEEEILDVWCDMARLTCGREDATPRELDRWEQFSAGKLWFYDQQGMVTSQKIRAVIRYCAEELKVTQFVVDSLMMLAIDRDNYGAQSDFVGELKLLAKDTGCTIHLVCHMRKRDNKSGDEMPGSLHDISGPHDIGSKADYVFNVWRDIKRSNPDNPDCVLGVEKQRGRYDWIGRFGLNFHQTSRQFIEGKYAMRFWGDE